MSVFKFRGKWRAQVFVGGRCVASRAGFERRGDAKEWHDDTLRSFKTKDAPEVPEASFAQLLEHFGKWHMPHLRPNTRVRYDLDIKYRIEPWFGRMKLADITPALIEEFKSKCQETLAPKSVNNCLHTLRLILNRAVRWRLIKQSPYETESIKIAKAPYVWWDQEDHVIRFLQAARKSRYFPIYLLALETGMRYGEIIGLSKQDIDFSRGTIHVHRQWLERHGSYGPVKHAMPRWVPFNPDSELGRELSRLVSESPHPEAVFTTSTGGRPGKGNIAEKYFKAIQRRAGVPVICFHGLRHTFASWYMQRRDNVWDLMVILGHSNVQTTMRYAHHSGRTRRQPLDLTAGLTHTSHTSEQLPDVTPPNYREKGWRDGRDLNPIGPIFSVS